MPIEKPSQVNLLLVFLGSLLVLVFLFIYSGCVSTSKAYKMKKDAYKQGYTDCDRDCLELQKKLGAHINKLNKQIKENDLKAWDETPLIRKPPVSKEPPVPTGNEDWLK